MFVNGTSGLNGNQHDSRSLTDALSTLGPDHNDTIIFPSTTITTIKSQTKPETLPEYSEEQRKKDSNENQIFPKNQ